MNIRVVMSHKSNTPTKKLNEKLYELMKARGLTMQSLASQAQIAIGTIQKLITDPSCNPTISSLEAICSAFKISLVELLGHETTPAIPSTNIVLLEWHELPTILHHSHFRERVAT